MPSMHLASGSSRLHALAALAAGARGTVHHVQSHGSHRADRLAALGVTPGAPVRVLQTFPGIVFECDQTELAVERAVAETIFIRIAEG